MSSVGAVLSLRVTRLILAENRLEISMDNQYPTDKLAKGRILRDTTGQEKHWLSY